MSPSCCAVCSVSLYRCTSRCAVTHTHPHCSAVHYSVVQFSTLQCSSVQSIAVQCTAVQFSTLQCSSVQSIAVQYTAVQFSTVQYREVKLISVLYSAVQFIAVQCSVVCLSIVKGRVQLHEMHRVNQIQLPPWGYSMACRMWSPDRIVEVVLSTKQIGLMKNKRRGLQAQRDC